MAAQVPESHRDLLEKPVVVTIATVSGDGQPFTAAVWRRWDGEFVRIVTDPNSRKVRNIAGNNKVSIIAIDPDNPYRFLGINGVVEGFITDRDESLEELNWHAKLYSGKERYYGNFEPIEEEASHNSVVLKIRPLRFIALG